MVVASALSKLSASLDDQMFHQVKYMAVYEKDWQVLFHLKQTEMLLVGVGWEYQAWVEFWGQY